MVCGAGTAAGDIPTAVGSGVACGLLVHLRTWQRAGTRASLQNGLPPWTFEVAAGVSAVHTGQNSEKRMVMVMMVIDGSYSFLTIFSLSVDAPMTDD